MSKQSYVISKDCRVPSVVVSTHPKRGTQMNFKTFRRGDIIQGEMKHSGNEPAFILSDNLVIPIACVKVLETREILSEASGTPTQAEADKAIKDVVVKTTPKVQYLDAAIIGAIAGAAIVFIIEKKTTWIKVPAKEYKIYGALAGALAGAYFIYRNKNTTKVTIKPKE